MQERMNDEVSPKLEEALATYLEQLNSSSDETKTDPAMLLSGEPELLQEWQQIVMILRLPQQAATNAVSASAAWERFRPRHFDVQVAPASLGSYVANALVADQKAVADSGLSQTLLEKMKSDPTPLDSLKSFELQDYVQVARRNGVSDSQFPRMLKWLKQLAKNVLTPPATSTRMSFAREDEYEKGLSEQVIKAELDKKDQDGD
jgi:hypothetical protein